MITRSSPIEEFVDDETEELDPSILQSMTRRLLDDGTEAVEGSVRIYFGPGERTAAAHVAFTPPLSDRPRVECQALSDFDGRVRSASHKATGSASKVRRCEPAREAVCVDVGFSDRSRRLKARQPDEQPAGRRVKGKRSTTPLFWGQGEPALCHAASKQLARAGSL